MLAGLSLRAWGAVSLLAMLTGCLSLDRSAEYSLTGASMLDESEFTLYDEPTLNLGPFAEGSSDDLWDQLSFEADQWGTPSLGMSLQRLADGRVLRVSRTEN